MKRIPVVFLLIFSLLSQPAVAAEYVYFYHTDNFGTPTAITDKKGKVVWHTDELPFGEEYRTEQTLPNNRRFLGKEQDEETGLIYMGARYLDPQTGRFTQPDPVGLVDARTGKVNMEILANPQRLNRYAYGLNNPYRYIDPDGEFAFALTAAIIGAAITYSCAPDVANAPESSSTPTFESHGERNIAIGAVTGGTLGSTSKTVGALLLSKKVVDGARVRHHTSIEGANAIKRTGVINPSRGGGVHVETMPFGSPKTASAETGAFGKGAYVEFDAPSNIVRTNIGPRNTGVVPTNKPLSIKNARPKIKKR